MENLVRVIDENTRLVTVRVNHDERMLAFPRASWTTEGRRESHIPGGRTGLVEEEIILRRFGRYMSSEDAVSALSGEKIFGEDALEPVSPEELRDLLKVTELDPNLPTPIAALGVSGRNPACHRYVPCLYGGTGRRYLSLADWSGHDWFYDWWFAAHRKSKR